MLDPSSHHQPATPWRGAALAIVYLCLSIPMGSWLGRIPDIKAGLGAGDGEWGAASSIASVGEIIGLVIIVVLIGRVSTRRITIAVAALTVALSPIIALSPTLPALITVLALWMAASKILGTTSGALILVHQRNLGRSIFGGFDALYSVGMLTGGLLSWAALHAGIPASTQFAITSCLLSAALLISLRALPDEEAPHRPVTTHRRKLRTRFTPALLLLGGICLLASIIDSAASQWAGIFLSRTGQGGPTIGALGYVLVMASKSVTLLFIDRLGDHFGWPATARASIAVAAIVLLIGVSFGGTGPAAAALLALGAGTAFIGPMVNTLASTQPGVTVGEARTVLEMGEVPAYVLTPVLVGLLASLTDVRWAFLALTCGPLLLCAAALRQLPRRPQ